MRWPRPQFRLRTLLIIVAAFAVLLVGATWGLDLWRKSVKYHHYAAVWDSLCKSQVAIVAQGNKVLQEFRQKAETADGSEMAAFWNREAAQWASRMESDRKTLEEYVRERNHYRRLASHPWEPDPPPPPEPDPDNLDEMLPLGSPFEAEEVSEAEK